MTFHERLKYYRYHELNIKSKEAAAILGLEPNTYSHYERGRNRFPIDLLPLMKEKFVMSDEMFLEILLQRPRKRLKASDIGARSRELQEAYLTKFGEDYFELLQNPDVRTVVAMLEHPDEDVKQQRIRELLQFMEESPLFRNTAADAKKVAAPKKPLRYKLNKQRTFLLVDGEKLPPSMKTDDIPADEQ